MRARGILKTAVATAAALALAGCGEFLNLDARAPNACVTVANIHIPGLNELPTNYVWPPQTISTRHSLDVPFDAAGLPKGSAYTVKLTSFKLESQGTQTLEFVESAELTAVAGKKSTLVVTYARSSTTPTKAIGAAAEPPADVTDYIVDDVLHLEGELTGTPPAKGFSAAATVCFDIATTLGAE